MTALAGGLQTLRRPSFFHHASELSSVIPAFAGMTELNGGKMAANRNRPTISMQAPLCAKFIGESGAFPQ